MDDITRNKYDIIIKHIQENGGKLDLPAFNNICSEQVINAELCFYYFSEFGLISKNRTIIILTEKGNDFIGFVKTKEQTILNHRKSLIDFKISKFKYYTFWPVFIFGLLGFIFGLYNFFNEKKSSDVSQKELTEKINQLKKEKDNDIIKALDIVYSDSTLLNK